MNSRMDKSIELSDCQNGLHTEQSKDQPRLRTFGWGKFRPEYLKFLTSSRWFLAIIMTYTFSAGISMNGLPVLILPSIEKRFSLSSKELGIIAAANDVAALLLVVFISYYGDYGNKIKWVGGGAVVAGCGLLLFSLPHFIIGPYDPPNFQSGKSGMCLPPSNTSSSESCGGSGGGSWYYMAIFVVAQLIHGAGICPLYSLVPAYLDDNVLPKQIPIYLGLWYLSAFLGPGIGILISGQFLSVYVDIDQPSGLRLTPKDPRWIGAWWLPFLVFGLLFLTLSIAISGFPHSLPGAEKRRQKLTLAGSWKESQTTATEAKIREILPQLKALLLNWTFLFNSFGVSLKFLFIGGLVPFLGKLLQLKFNLDPVRNGYLISAIMTPTITVGVFLGSLVVRQFPTKHTCKRSALYVAVSQMLTLVAPFAILLPGCLNKNIAGVSRAYINSGLNFTHGQMIPTYTKDALTSHCNLNCSCDIGQFTPVCGEDNIVYANPCYAGCVARYDNQTFGNCSCIVGEDNQFSMARHGYCDRKCENLVVFLVIIGLTLFIQFSCAVPVQTVVLRCVPENKRSFAMGMQYVFLKTIGLIPGPIIFGHVLDLCCRLWQEVCGRKGRCLDYDVVLASRNLCIFGAVATGVAVVFFLLSWLLYRPKEKTVPSEVENNNADVMFENVLSRKDRGKE